MSRLNELVQERAQILTQATEISTKLKTEGREDLNTEERATIDKITARSAELETEIAKIQQDEADRDADKRRVESLRNVARNANRNDSRRSSPPAGGHKPKERLEDAPEYRTWFDQAVRGRHGDHREMSRAADQLESRAFSLGTNSAGGYMSLPTAVRNDLVSTIDEISGISGLATRVDIGDAKQLGITKVTSRGDDADWTSEITTVLEDASSAVGRRDFTPTLVTKGYRASMVWVERSPDAVPFVFKQLARLFSVTQEKAMLTGSGSSAPLGLFTASASGISTGRDVTCASTSVFTYAELMELKYSIKQPYHNSPAFGWVVHRDFVRKALTLLDSQNRPIFIPAAGVGLQDMLLGAPVRYSEFAPDTYSASQYVAVLGDMSQYWIVDAMKYSVQVLDQLYAVTNQIGYIGRMERDGSPLLEEAFARLKLHA